MADYVAVASGGLFIILATFMGHNRDRRISLGLSAFLLMWGMQIAVANTASFAADDGTKHLLIGLSYLFMLPIPLSMFYLASLPAKPGAARNKWQQRALHGFKATLGLAGIVLLVGLFAPARLIGEGGAAAWGQLGPVLVILPTLIGTALGLFLLAQALFPKPAGGGAAGVGTPHEPLVRPNLLFAGLWLAVASLPAWFLGIIPGAKEGIDTAMGGAFNTLQLIVFGFASLAILLWTSTFVVLRGRNRYLAGSVVLVLGWGLLLAWLTPAQREELLWGVGASAGLLRIPAAILLGMATFPSIRHAYSRSGRKAGIRQIARVVPAEVIASGTMLASLVLILPLDSSSQSQLRLVAVIVVLGCALASLAWFALSQERAPQTLTGLSGQESSEVAAHALETFNTDHP